MQLRILVSARNAPTVWDLRCEVREHLINHLQVTYPQALPGTTKITFPPIKASDAAVSSTTPPAKAS